MRDAVKRVLPIFMKRYEGEIPFMYLDIIGLVTVGIGNLIDPLSTALALPFVHRSSGAPASKEEIEAEWRLIKNTPRLKKEGAGAAGKLCRLKLRSEDIAALVARQAENNEKILKRYFPLFDKFPADAQLALHSMAWAMGAGFPKAWPRFSAAVLQQDWLAASENCKIREAGNPGVVPRNKANRQLFLSAAAAATPEQFEKVNWL